MTYMVKMSLNSNRLASLIAPPSEQNSALFVILKTNNNGEYIFFSQKRVQAF